eukprot:360643-Chlamydomonas_euryale.AAC.6
MHAPVNGAKPVYQTFCHARKPLSLPTSRASVLTRRAAAFPGAGLQVRPPASPPPLATPMQPPLSRNERGRCLARTAAERGKRSPPSLRLSRPSRGRGNVGRGAPAAFSAQLAIATGTRAACCFGANR